MYISPRAAQARNLSLATVNGTLTLIILLIAPLGLAAVIINTVLVALATYCTAVISDRVIRYLQKDSTSAELIGNSPESNIERRSQSSDLNR
ncbi:CRISPR-associated protein Csx18 [Thermosynechococcaceae cyanobacterium BACA0444]|uniref:CRISPR-associated protein Csx18 n=1 Tax=Pseudocalidococcus azoricus BACA0444 TaxID=2918990 RepID=A0AAE4FVB0_9CYAN|nr:CRISPR-associated protein Csx18 [Pseudocalidococcus azoricus]MDS3861711.1 CRISPR-associated protein Csx18 [Pseudocalidococcus azoricus BACA0444]